MQAAGSPKPVYATPAAASRQSALDTLLEILKTPELAADAGSRREYWAEIKRLAEIHRFSGLLAHSASAWLPPSERQWRDQTLMRHHRQHAHRLGALRILGEAFHAGGVEVVSLKGPLLAERFYAVPFLRPSNDIDLLIRKNDVGRAARLMRKLGFKLDGSYPWKLQHRLVHHLNFDATEFSPRVEMHYDLRAGGHTFEAAGFIDRAVSWRSPSGVEFPVLRVADEAFYSCVHAAKHMFHRLRWLYDTIVIARGLTASERTETKALAIRHRQAGHFVGAVMAAREFFGEQLNLDCAGFPTPFLWNALALHHTRKMVVRVEGTSSTLVEKIGCRLDRLRLAGSPWSAAQFLAWQLDIEVRKRWYDISHTPDPEALLKTLPD
jgi:hypothetical protein